jgi:hypothetical protein
VCWAPPGGSGATRRVSDTALGLRDHLPRWRWARLATQPTLIWSSLRFRRDKTGANDRGSASASEPNARGLSPHPPCPERPHWDVGVGERPDVHAPLARFTHGGFDYPRCTLGCERRAVVSGAGRRTFSLSRAALRFPLGAMVGWGVAGFLSAATLTPLPLFVPRRALR